MRHPTEGALRRLVDEPAGVAESDRQHVSSCPQCLDDLAAARADASFVAAALAPVGSPHDASPTGIDAAWQRVSTAATDGGQQPIAVSGARRSRTLLRRPAAAALAAAVVLAGASTAAATDWLQIFRTEKITPVSISTADLISLPDLSAYGDLALAGGPEMHEVDNAAEAEAESGLDVPEVRELPQGVRGEPVYQVGREVTATFTFSADRAARAAAKAGKPLPAPPHGMDGSSLKLVAGPGVAQVWSSSRGAPALIVGRAVAPSAYSSGLPFETVRDYLLSLPGLPDEAAQQLRTFAADGSTLPLPVPADEVTSGSTEVDGVAATLLTSRDRTFAAVVWVDDGVVTVVAGSLEAEEVVEIGRELQ